ncbi:MAG: 3-isopropylmalate dehydratase small subunit [Mucispirillum sp.]|nr:3-isopropylmalate dehydratase small subunit [Mucispirillum sp.]
MTGAIKEIKGRALPMAGDDIDTDRIIPARFLRCVTFDGLGEQAFRDERFDAGGNPTNHPMNDEAYKGANIILSGNNFGCGSSREHAPQAIKRAGYNAIIAESFAEIFYGNASVLGLACITLPKKEIEELGNAVKNNPKLEITIDIEKSEIKAGDKTYEAGIKETLKNSFLNGTYDTIYELMKNNDAISEIDKKLPPKCFS